MKRTILLLTTSFITISSFCQQFACKQDTVHFYQSNYRGILSWQKSENGTDWSPLPGSQKDTLAVVATSPAYYRSEVIEGLCRPYYSEIIQLIVNELPVVTLQVKDSACLNQTPFILDGGLPSGGSYWGDGIIDGKFSPAFASAGRHRINYRFSDSLTGCADSAYSFITVSPLPNHAQAGIDLLNVPADSVLLDANIPENGIGTWSVTNGSKGHFSNPHAPKTWFIKDSANLQFTLNWSITGKCGNSSDEIEISFFQISKHPCPDAPTVTDADGNVYPTVQIGNQCWMAKNINVGRFVTSTSDIVPHSNLSNNSIIEKYCYENKIENCNLYGGLYDWDEAMGYSDAVNALGICPEGWHIPSETDWVTLNKLFPTFTAGENLKVGKDSGFDGFFSGDRHALSGFYSLDASGFWWQSGSYINGDVNEGFLREIEACNGKLTRTHFGKKTGLSVRCIKNN